MQLNILGKKLFFIIAHPDDESVLAAGKVSKQLAKFFDLPFLMFAGPMQMQTAQVKRWFKAKRHFGKYAQEPFFLKPNIQIKIQPLIKRKAMQMHKSQFGADGFPPK